MKINEINNFTLKELLGVKFYDAEGKFEIILLDLVNEQKGLFLIKNIKDGELSKRVCTKENLMEVFSINTDEVRHEKYQMIKDVLMDGFNPYLVGGAGSGKNYVCEQIAKSMGLPFYCINCVTQEFKILGYGDANGNYVETDFYKCFTNGGVILIDEIDASCPDALIILNSALANGYLNFPVVGAKTKHNDFYCISAGNTCGKGADELYNARMTLDAASLNRFFCIEFDYDRRIEEKCALYDNELVDFAHAVRNACQRIKYNLVFSYRDLSMIARLQKYMKADVALMGSVFKGCNKDTLNNLYYNCCNVDDNKYYKEMYKLIKNN